MAQNARSLARIRVCIHVSCCVCACGGLIDCRFVFRFVRHDGESPWRSGRSNESLLEAYPSRSSYCAWRWPGAARSDRNTLDRWLSSFFSCKLNVNAISHCIFLLHILYDRLSLIRLHNNHCDNVVDWNHWLVLLVEMILSSRSFELLIYCELHNNRPKTAETSAIRVS